MKTTLLILLSLGACACLTSCLTFSGPVKVSGCYENICVGVEVNPSAPPLVRHSGKEVAPVQ
jgi:hypothetical protein